MVEDQSAKSRTAPAARRIPLPVMIVVIAGVAMFAGTLTWVGVRTHATTSAANEANEPTKQESNRTGSAPTDDLKSTQRQKYLDKVRKEMNDYGSDAFITDEDGNLVIVSDRLKVKEDRDALMRGTFDSSYRKWLCSAGFKTVELKGGYVLSDGDRYSLGCPETNEERSARLASESTQRRDFVKNLQSGLDSDEELHEYGQVNVKDANGILTMSGIRRKGIPRKTFLSLINGGSGDDDYSKLCSIGFIGLRVKNDESDPGLYVPFRCRE